jgi:hypothetical protein
MKYSEITKTKEYKEDRGCCTVVATSVAFDKPFKEIQDYFFTQGRKKNQGFAFESALYKLGKKYNFNIKKYSIAYSEKGLFFYQSNTDKPRYPSYSHNPKFYIKSERSLTVGNWKKYLNPNKTYILGFQGSICHVGAVKNGSVEDWTDGRRYVVSYYYEIEKNKNVSRQTKTFLDNLKDFNY